MSPNPFEEIEPKRNSILINTNAAFALALPEQKLNSLSA